MAEELLQLIRPTISRSTLLAMRVAEMAPLTVTGTGSVEGVLAPECATAAEAYSLMRPEVTAARTENRGVQTEGQEPPLCCGAW